MKIKDVQRLLSEAKQTDNGKNPHVFYKLGFKPLRLPTDMGTMAKRVRNEKQSTIGSNDGSPLIVQGWRTYSMLRRMEAQLLAKDANKVTVFHTGQFSRQIEVKSGNRMRAKNPFAKAYKFIQGKYAKI